METTCLLAIIKEINTPSILRHLSKYRRRHLQHPGLDNLNWTSDLRIFQTRFHCCFGTAPSTPITMDLILTFIKSIFSSRLVIRCIVVTFPMKVISSNLACLLYFNAFVTAKYFSILFFFLGGKSGNWRDSKWVDID